MTDSEAQQITTPEAGPTTSPQDAAGDDLSIGSIWRTLGPAGPLAVIAATLPGISGFLLAGYMGTVSRFLQSHGSRGLLIYCAAFAVASGLAILPTWVQAVLGGFAFGIARGVPAALAGFAAGSIIGYEVARRASGDRLLATINRHPKLKAVREAFIDDRLERGFLKTLGVVALLRLPPNSPFAVTNLVLASVRVPRLPYLLGTIIGMAPRTIAAVVIGDGVAKAITGTDIANPDFSVPRWLWLAGIVLMVAVLAVLGTIANRVLARLAGKPAEQPSADR